MFGLLYLFRLILRLAPVAATFFFLMIRRPPRSTLDRSSAASDVYKRQGDHCAADRQRAHGHDSDGQLRALAGQPVARRACAVSYTHLRAHETVLDLVCRLLLEKKNTTIEQIYYCSLHNNITTSMHK